MGYAIVLILTFNHGVLGSSPSALTTSVLLLAARGTEPRG
jgi:hypothetical protein